MDDAHLPHSKNHQLALEFLKLAQIGQHLDRDIEYGPILIKLKLLPSGKPPKLGEKGYHDYQLLIHQATVKLNRGGRSRLMDGPRKFKVERDNGKVVVTALHNSVDSLRMLIAAIMRRRYRGITGDIDKWIESIRTAPNYLKERDEQLIDNVSRARETCDEQFMMQINWLEQKMLSATPRAK